MDCTVLPFGPNLYVQHPESSAISFFKTWKLEFARELLELKTLYYPRFILLNSVVNSALNPVFILIGGFSAPGIHNIPISKFGKHTSEENSTERTGLYGMNCINQDVGRLSDS
jgi:hypothetical protein